ncbi:MAG TPA: hypothetical protein VK724_18070 [Bryobacteraceae bacterium]|jgi:hypothetical protein|nr:hypothetical protein [Bryobacteraceae bacterium]
MKCKICDTRKPRRYCPGVSGEICSLCCGNEREVTISCPFECPYLREARLHEKPHSLNPDEVPNRDIHVTEQFLREHEPLLMFLSSHLLDASLSAAGAVDSDVREALQSLIRTYRTLESGLYYETRPANLIAAGIHQRMQEAVEILRKELAEKNATPLRGAEILGTLVFLERVELNQNNGRPRGRAFLDYLRVYFPQNPESIAPPASLIQV